MILSTKQIVTPDDIRRMENEFYKKDFYFSYSSINRLLWNPAAFYQQYVLGIKEDKLDKHLIEGKVIHALLLSNELFDKLFVVMPGSVPDGKQRKVLDVAFFAYEQQEVKTRKELEEFGSEILEAMQELDYYQSFVDEKKADANGVKKTADQKRLEKVITPDAKEYFSYLKHRGTRDVIDYETLVYCQQALEKVRQNQKVMKLLGLHDEEFSNTEILNEIYVQTKLANYPFGLHGYIDNLVIDHDKKIIKINDLKTSGKGLKDFKESLDYYSYWMQAVIYVNLVAKKYSQLVKDEYAIQFRFIVIDCNLNVYPFQVSSETMAEWQNRLINEGLFKAHYHYTQKQYSLPYEFAEELVVL
jgi:hypothetical protein